MNSSLALLLVGLLVLGVGASMPAQTESTERVCYGSGTLETGCYAQNIGTVTHTEDNDTKMPVLAVGTSLTIVGAFFLFRD